MNYNLRKSYRLITEEQYEQLMENLEKGETIALHVENQLEVEVLMLNSNMCKVEITGLNTRNHLIPIDRLKKKSYASMCVYLYYVWDNL